MKKEVDSGIQAPKRRSWFGGSSKRDSSNNSQNKIESVKDSAFADHPPHIASILNRADHDISLEEYFELQDYLKQLETRKANYEKDDDDLVVPTPITPKLDTIHRNNTCKNDHLIDDMFVVRL